MSKDRNPAPFFLIIPIFMLFIFHFFYPIHRTGRPNKVEYSVTNEKTFESLRDAIQNTFSEFKPCMFLEKGQVLTFSYKVNLSHGNITVFIMQRPTRGIHIPRLIDITQSSNGSLEYQVVENGLYEIAISLYAFKWDLDFSWEINDNEVK